MATATRCPGDDCPTIGVDATRFDDYGDVETEHGEWLIYDLDDERAWIQSDLYVSRESCV